MTQQSHHHARELLRRINRAEEEIKNLKAAVQDALGSHQLLQIAHNTARAFGQTLEVYDRQDALAVTIKALCAHIAMSKYSYHPAAVAQAVKRHRTTVLRYDREFLEIRHRHIPEHARTIDLVLDSHGMLTIGTVTGHLEISTAP